MGNSQALTRAPHCCGLSWRSPGCLPGSSEECPRCPRLSLQAPCTGGSRDFHAKVLLKCNFFWAAITPNTRLARAPHQSDMPKPSSVRDITKLALLMPHYFSSRVHIRCFARLHFSLLRLSLAETSAADGAIIQLPKVAAADTRMKGQVL